MCITVKLKYLYSCFGTNLIYYIYSLLKFTVPKNCNYRSMYYQTNVLLSQA